MAPSGVVAHSSSWTPAAYEPQEVLLLRLFGLVNAIDVSRAPALPSLAKSASCRSRGVEHRYSHLHYLELYSLHWSRRHASTLTGSVTLTLRRAHAPSGCLWRHHQRPLCSAPMSLRTLSRLALLQALLQCYWDFSSTMGLEQSRASSSFKVPPGT